MTVDLYVTHGGRRTSAELYEQLRDAVATGRLRAGDRLPTSRALAAELGVARSTVTAVYGRLVAEGVADARTGDGTFVAGAGGAAARPPGTVAVLTPRRLAHRPPSPPVVGARDVDLRTGLLDPALFPLADWRRCVVDALQSRPPGYGDAAGLPALRGAIAAWVSRSRGVRAGDSQVLVTSGAQQAFDLLGRTLLGPGDTVAVEDPGYPSARWAFAAHGLEVAPVPVDREGIVVDAIPARARAVYVTPSHQSPTGVTMSAARRRALLAFASTNDAAVIEDDYDTEFRHLDRPFEPIQRLDTEGRVIYVGTFSKTLSPSLRIGFLIAPDALVDEMAAGRRLADAQPPHLTQAALTELIVTGGFERHLRRSRRVVAARHTVVAEAIAALHRDGLVAEPTPMNAGLHAMLELHPGSDAAALAARLARRGVVLDATDHWWAGPVGRPGLLVGFGLADVDSLRKAFTEIHDELGSERVAVRVRPRP
jgi:GntR family transcriptional regulator/MocR family aminotransferase